jgi:hypothetical protein
MHKIVDPKQTRLFDSFDSILTDKTRKRLIEGWQGVFRNVILELMPVEQISEHFDPAMGRPTKELYSIAGLLLIKEFMNWTKPESLDAYSFHTDIQYALNLEPVAHDISMRTIERYINLFEEDEIAKTIMSKVTTKLVESLDIRIDKQRLDSTHIFSDMAGFGRTRLMGVAMKRFLTQLKRHNVSDYESVEVSLRQRYAPGVNQLFADAKRDGESRRLLREQVAEDMYYLIITTAIPQTAAESDANAVEDVVEDLETNDLVPAGKTKTVMPQSACSRCAYVEECPVTRHGEGYRLEHTAKQRRLAGRRREEATEAFRDRYRVRAGIEGTNSGLKRRTGLGQLRVRGRPAVFNAIYLKIAGWNILRASVCAKMRQIVYARANKAVWMLIFMWLRIKIAVESVCMSLKRYFCVLCRQFEKFSMLSKAA